MIAEQRNNEDSCKDKPDVLKIQYNKLAEDWRYFNTLLWGIPSVAIAIMAGIIIASLPEGCNRLGAYCLTWFRLFPSIRIDNREHKKKTTYGCDLTFDSGYTEKRS